MAADADCAGQLSSAAGQNNNVDTAPGEPLADIVDVEPVVRQGSSTMRWPIVLAVVVLVVLGSLFAWLGYRAYEARQAQQHHDLFLQVGRQGAINLTTISAAEAAADVGRILDSTVGTFHDDFAQRAPALIEVVKKAQSNTEGSVTAAALESWESDRARVLVAVSVMTSNAVAPGQRPRMWRMRIDVNNVGGGVKVANVEFVP